MDFITWGAFLATGTSLVALVKFWMDLGAMAAEAKAAAQAATLLMGNVALLKDDHARFQVEVARTYATARSLEATEAALERGIEKALGGIYQRLDGMTQRLDSLITLSQK